MSSIRIYGHKGMILGKPFRINSVDDEPEAIAEEKEISSISSASDTEQTDEIQGSAPDE